MPTLWQRRDGGAGLSRIDVSWRRFVVAHPCTLGTIKLKIIGSESPPFIDPLESVNSPRHKRQRIQRQREKCRHSHTYTHKQKGVEGRVCKRKGKEKETQAHEGFNTSSQQLNIRKHVLKIAVTGSQWRLNQVNFFISEDAFFTPFWSGAETVVLTLLDPHLSPVTVTPASYLLSLG